MIVRTAMAAAGVVIASAALACPPPPPPPEPPSRNPDETVQAYQTRYDQYKRERETAAQLDKARWNGYREGVEQGLWSASEQIVVVEVIGKGTDEELARQSGPYPLSKLRVVERIRGKSSNTEFSLTYAGETSCGPYGPVNVAEGRIGQHFVIFARHGDLGMDTVIGGVSRTDTLYSQTQGFLAKYQDK